jgi:hypothetical protein
MLDFTAPNIGGFVSIGSTTTYARNNPGVDRPPIGIG